MYLGNSVGLSVNFGSGYDLVLHEFGPKSGSMLTAHSLELASGPVSPSLSAPPLLTLYLSFSLSLKNKINIKKKEFTNKYLLRI